MSIVELIHGIRVKFYGELSMKPKTGTWTREELDWIFERACVDGLAMAADKADAK